LRHYRPCRPASRRAFQLAGVALLAALPVAVRAASVWVTGSCEKVLPSAGARPFAAATVKAARNEFEAFQIAITADAGAVLDVTAAATPLSGPGTIAPPRLFREELIHLANASAPDGFTGDVPDALVPDVDDVVGEKRNAFPFAVGAGQTRVIWAEVHVPADAPAGVYQGSVTVTAGGATISTVPVELTVWDFALPSTSSLKSHFGLAYGSLPTQHGVSGDAFSVLRARYAQLGLDHRISVSSFDDGYFGDLAHFEQFFGPLVNGTAPTQLQGAKLTSVRFLSTPDKRTASTYASWASFFRARGWFDRLFDYTCDEPPATCAWSDILARNATMKAGDPGFRSLVTTDVQSATANGVLSSIDVIVPVVNFVDGKSSADFGGWDDQYSGLQRSKYDADLASGSAKELWMYQSCMSHGCGGTSDYFTGWPSYMIDTASLRSRAMEWLSFAWGVTGELYWDTTYAYTEGSADPWADQWQFSGNGDGTLFYPGTPARIGGTTDIPVASLRLKMIRAGMQDYEYLKLLSDAGDPQLAHQLATTLFPNAWTEPSVSDLSAARDRIAARILELTGKPPAADPGPGGGAGDGSGSSALAPSGAAISGSASLGAASGSGCSAGSTGGALAGLGLLAALATRRRRRR
jgi:MYXO-CTERM domain-containing protein